MELLKITEDLWQTAEIGEWAKAMSEFKKEVPSIPKNGKGQFGAYMLLDDLIESVTPLLAKHNLFFTQDIAGTEMVTSILHSSGQFRVSKSPLQSMIGNKGTNNLQQLGAAITYLKRYTLSAILGISADTDDDGASGKNTQQSSKPKTEKKPGPAKKPAPLYTEAKHQALKGLLKNYKGGDRQHIIDTIERKIKEKKYNDAMIEGYTNFIRKSVELDTALASYHGEDAMDLTTWVATKREKGEITIKDITDTLDKITKKEAA